MSAMGGMWWAYWGTLEIAKLDVASLDGAPNSVNNVANLCEDMRLHRPVLACRLGGPAASGTPAHVPSGV